jgi:DNA-binding NarL/FixJ family response regulator
LHLAIRVGRSLGSCPSVPLAPTVGIPSIEGVLHENSGGHGAELRALSPRERKVLEVTSLGLTNEEVAAQLSVSVHAVKFHLASIYRKLGVANRTEAAVTFLRATGEN